MRPTDEDQSSQRRPNLMSATRRAASETNILAMLDRQASAALPRRLLRAARALPAMVWYATAGVLVCGLLATLAWLARDRAASTAVDSALAGSVAPAHARMAEAAVPRVADASASVTAYMPADRPADRPADMPADAPAPPPVSVSMSVSTSAPASPPEPARPAAHAAMARAVAPHAAAPGKQATAGTAAAAPARAGRTSTHNRRPAPPAKAPPAAVDTDVALISAIIQHAANRQEAEEGGCADKACGARKP